MLFATFLHTKASTKPPRATQASERVRTDWVNAAPTAEPVDYSEDARARAMHGGGNGAGGRAPQWSDNGECNSSLLSLLVIVSSFPFIADIITLSHLPLLSSIYLGQIITGRNSMRRMRMKRRRTALSTGLIF